MLTCDGKELKKLLEGGTAWLDKHRARINALNVFPVPDGDTGTNMVLTMKAALEEMANSIDDSVSAVAKAVSYGSLMGARGNSGVILSQIFRGIARSFEDKDVFNATDLAEALVEGSSTAYKGVIKPVEGTILTVAREAADAAITAANERDDIAYVLEKVVNEARKSVERTPFLLPVLREAGVVDAGGEGLFILFEGMLRCLKGEDLTVDSGPSVTFDFKAFEGEEYGYDTQFVIRGENLNVDEIREEIAKMGDSVMVVGDSKVVKVHIHTDEPGTPLNYAVRLGALSEISIENMQEQYREFVKAKAPVEVPREEREISTVVVAPGEGLALVFQSLGADAVVPGGQTMNPSTEELLRAIEGVEGKSVILLPNNPNVIMTAKQAGEISTKNVIVVPTKTIPQGISALLAFNYQADLETNANMMERAAQEVKTAEITTATRDVKIKGVSVEEGQVIGLLNGELTASGQTKKEVVKEMLCQMKAEEGELITIYYGEGVDSAEAEDLADLIRKSYPEQEVELIDGGQPHYPYIISVE
jgi:hypothetical protein